MNSSRPVRIFWASGLFAAAAALPLASGCGLSKDAPQSKSSARANGLPAGSSDASSNGETLRTTRVTVTGTDPGGASKRNDGSVPTGGKGETHGEQVSSNIVQEKVCTVAGTGPLAKVRQLWRTAYLNEVEDVLGAGARPIAQTAAGLSDATSKHFRFASVGSITTDLSVKSLVDSAEALADWSLSDATRANGIFGCAAKTITGATARTCFSTFLDNKAPRILRRALPAAEKTALLTFFDSEAAQGAGEGFRAGLAALLAHPDFLYVRAAPAGGGNNTALDAWSLASRLSFALLNRGPDAQLMASAKSGALVQEAELKAQVKRLLALPAAQENILEFYRKWLRYGALPQLSNSPAFLAGASNANLGAQAVSEADAFLRRITFETAGTPADIFTSRNAPALGSSLAAVYGVQAGAALELPPERAGVLTRAAMLLSGNDNFSVVKRGLPVLEDVLCKGIAEPPPTVNLAQASAQADSLRASFRKRIESVTTPAPCAGCHLNINPAGAARGNFDGLGRLITSEKHFSAGALDYEVPVDAKASLALIGPNTVDGGAELGASIAASERFKRCFPAQFVRFALGREDAGDGCVSDAGAKALAAGGGVVDVFTAVLTSPEFRLWREE